MGHPRSPSSRSKSIPQHTLRSWYGPAILSQYDFDPSYAQLNGGILGGNALTVTSDVEHPAHHDAEEHHPHIEQSDKPRAGSKYKGLLHVSAGLNALPLVAAEYLAKGYKLHDSILQRAIEIDSTSSTESESKVDVQSYS